MSATSLKRALMADVYDGAALETLLAVDGSLADYTELINSYSESIYLAGSVHALDAIVNSSTAWEMWLESWIARLAIASSDFGTWYVCQDGAALVPFLESNTLLKGWLLYPENLRRIQNQVNATGSKLKRQVFTSSGTWTMPATVLAQSAMIIGGGSGGNYQYGGGGGEMKTENFSSLSTGNESVGVGSGGSAQSSSSQSNGSASSFKSVSAAGGSGTAGGGTTTGNGYKDMTDWENPTNAFWQAATVSQQGNNGGSFTSFSALQVAPLGTERIPGRNGRPAYNYYDNGGSSLSKAATSGKFPCGGGGGGCWQAGGSAAGSVSAQSTDYGAGGAAGSFAYYSSYGFGSAGISGLVVHHWVEG